MLLQGAGAWGLVYEALASSRWHSFAPWSLSALMGGMKMAAPYSSLGAESSPSLLFSEPSQKSSQSPILFLWFPSEPCVHPAHVQAFLSQVCDQVQNSEFHRCWCRGPTLFLQRRVLLPLPACPRKAVPWPPGSMQFIAETRYQDPLFSAGLLAAMRGNSSAPWCHPIFLQPRRTSDHLLLLGFCHSLPPEHP